MKLMIRSFESEQTLQINVPNSCTLSQLKQTLAQSLTDSVRLSLNRKDDLRSDAGDSLHSLGIADGDLIYFSLEQPPAPVPPNSQNALPEAQNPDLVSQMEETVEEESGVGDAGAGKDHKRIVIAVHSIMLESGFVSFDKNTNTVVSGFQFGNEWPLPLSRVYTLKESTNSGIVVVLKFQSLGNFFDVRGTLENGSGNNVTYHVQLDMDQLIPFLNVNCGLIDSAGEENGGLLGASPRKEVFEFWRSVKDNLVLPLLIDICEEFGLELPPCFVGLPTDLKMRILESLSGVEIAKASCVCSELRHLGSSEDLWKVKFGQEFQDRAKRVTRTSWKKDFVRAKMDFKLKGVMLERSKRRIRLLLETAGRAGY